MNYFVSPTKTASVSQQINGLYAGKVSRVVDGEVFVEVPSIINGFSFGPAIISNYSSTPSVNDVVICGFLNNSLDEIVILGKSPYNPPASIAVDDLTDVSIGGLLSGHTLVYDGVQFVNQNVLHNASLTGTTSAPTPSTGDDSTSIATTEFVQNSLLFPIITKTTNFTVTNNEAMTFIRGTASVMTITLPSTSTVSLPIGTQFIYQQAGGAAHQFTAGAGVSIQSTPGVKLRTLYSVATAVKISDTEWSVFGDLIA